MFSLFFPWRPKDSQNIKEPTTTTTTTYLATWTCRPNRWWRRRAEALRVVSCPCTNQWSSPCKWAASCRGWLPHKTGQSMSEKIQIKIDKIPTEKSLNFRKFSSFKEETKKKKISLRRDERRLRSLIIRPYKKRSWDSLSESTSTRGHYRNTKRSHLYTHTHAFLTMSFSFLLLHLY